MVLIIGATALTAGVAAPAIAVATSAGAPAIATATSGGAIAVAGAAAGGTATATAVGSGAVATAAAVGTGATATATATTTAAALGTAAVDAAGVLAGVVTGPVGWITVGAEKLDDDQLSWDCWKKVVHDNNPIPSKGMALRDLLVSDAVSDINWCKDGFIHIRNKWDESFRVDFVVLPSGEVAAHAESL